MKRSTAMIITAALAVGLVLPSAAFAAQKASKGAAKREAQQTRKAERTAAKTERKAGRTLESSDTVESSETVSAGRTKSFERITTNLEKALLKIEAGKKSQLPPGLVNVWLKFAAWLNIDPATMPGATVVPSDDPSDEPTDTVEPTATVEPPSTVLPAPAVEPVVEPAL